MNKILRNIFILLVIIIFIVAFSPSYTSLNIDNLAYVIALGIDVGENEDFNISFQFTTGSSTSDSGSSEKSPLIINSVEASSIDSAINLMNSYLAKKINLSHCRLLIFSEEVASQGISDAVYTLANDSQVRHSANIIVSKNTAKDYMQNSTPILENLITKYYEIFPNSSKYTGYIYNVTFADFLNQYLCNTCEPFAILGGVNKNANTSENTSQSTSVTTMKSTNTPFSGDRGAENLGIAVFKDDKLVGELTAIETLCLSILRGDTDSFLISVPDPDNPEKLLDIKISNEGHKKIKVDIVNGSPYIRFEAKFTGRVYSMKDNAHYLDDAMLEAISNAANQYLEEALTQYLYRTSMEFKSDISGFGKYALSSFLTAQDFEEYDWQNSYVNSTFKVTIDTEIQSGFLINET